MRFLNRDCNPDSLSPATLAFVGDGVFELLTREYLACQANRPAKDLNAAKVQMVSAPAQAAGYARMESLLTEAERAVFRRGRNAHTAHTPKNATHAQYHAATGVEALFGWLYLHGRTDRAAELFDAIFSAQSLDKPEEL